MKYSGFNIKNNISSMMAPVLLICIMFTFVSVLPTHSSSRTLLDYSILNQSTQEPPNDERDCCERITGLLYDSIDCWDDNTPIIVKEAQDYLMKAGNHCTNRTKCGYSTASLNIPSTAETEKCLIAWTLIQQYYNECPQLIQSQSDDDHSTKKMINPLIYNVFNGTEHCSQCYGEYLECGTVTICNLPSNSNNCGLCSMVTCYGDINNANDPQTFLEGSDAKEMWYRSLLILMATTMLLVCLWGSCYMSKAMVVRQALGGGHPLRRDMIPVSNVEDNDDDSS